jgi:hypothetical protein
MGPCEVSSLLIPRTYSLACSCDAVGQGKGERRVASGSHHSLSTLSILDPERSAGMISQSVTSKYSVSVDPPTGAGSYCDLELPDLWHRRSKDSSLWGPEFS